VTRKRDNAEKTRRGFYIEVACPAESRGIIVLEDGLLIVKGERRGENPDADRRSKRCSEGLSAGPSGCLWNMDLEKTALPK